MKYVLSILLMLVVISSFGTTVLADSIDVLSATYGSNCGASQDNVLSHLAHACNGEITCSYTINHEVIGDPARGCAKNYIATYSCGILDKPKNIFVDPEATYHRITLDCRNLIEVISAEYGRGTCSTWSDVTSDIRNFCNGKAQCTYLINHNRIGDPARGCHKDYYVKWRCGNKSISTYDERVGGFQSEASGTTVTLSCPNR